MSSSLVSEVKRVYQAQAEAPVVTKAWFGGDARKIVVQTTVKDVHANKNRKFLSHYAIVEDQDPERLRQFTSEPVGFPCELSPSVAYVLPSKSGRLIALFKRESSPSSSSSSSAKVDSVDVLDCRSQVLLASIPLDKHHGRVYTGVPFGAPQWDPTETRIVYSAEPKEPKKSGFFASEAATSASTPSEEEGEDSKGAQKADEDGPSGMGREHEWSEHWGEQLSTAHTPRLFVLDVASKGVQQLTHEVDMKCVECVSPVLLYHSHTYTHSHSHTYTFIHW
jgi:hypothetical protein